MSFDVQGALGNARSVLNEVDRFADLIGTRALDPSVDRPASEIVAADRAVRSARENVAATIAWLERYAVRVGVADPEERPVIEQMTPVGL